MLDGDSPLLRAWGATNYHPRHPDADLAVIEFTNQGEVIIYDPGNEDAWIKGESRDIGREEVARR